MKNDSLLLTFFFFFCLSIQPFHPMVNLECSTEIRPFLCALYAPVCTEYGRVTLPCRHLCQRAKSDCYKLMDMFGVSWPDEMECSRYRITSVILQQDIFIYYDIIS